MFDVLQDLDEIEVKFKQLEETKERYNRWQVELETNQDTFENLEELPEELMQRQGLTSCKMHLQEDQLVE